MKHAMFLFVTLIAVAGPVNGAGAPVERLYTPEAPGFIVGYHAERDGASIVERVKTGETVEAWSAMITTQSFPQKPDLPGFLQVFANGWKNACPGSVIDTAVLTTSAGGVQEGALHASCPRNPGTGKPENVRVRAFATDSYLYVTQVAYRHVPTAAEDAWSKAYLSKATVCAAGSKDVRCR